jgi:hypothetical protein
VAVIALGDRIDLTDGVDKWVIPINEVNIDMIASFFAFSSTKELVAGNSFQ